MNTADTEYDNMLIPTTQKPRHTIQENATYRNIHKHEYATGKEKKAQQQKRRKKNV